jgi:hypothetical protein
VVVAPDRFCTPQLTTLPTTSLTYCHPRDIESARDEPPHLHLPNPPIAIPRRPTIEVVDASHRTANSKASTVPPPHHQQGHNHCYAHLV